MSYTKSPEAIGKLTAEQFGVTQRSGTEAPGTGEHLDNHDPGIYVDIVSGEPLFASSDKYPSATYGLDKTGARQDERRVYN